MGLIKGIADTADKDKRVEKPVKTLWVPGGGVCRCELAGLDDGFDDPTLTPILIWDECYLALQRQEEKDIEANGELSNELEIYK